MEKKDGQGSWSRAGKEEVRGAGLILGAMVKSLVSILVALGSY